MKDFDVAIINENKEIFKEKMLTADVFESSHNNGIKALWTEAKDIEITFDFIQYSGDLIKKIISKVLPKI